jgi:tetratricopeptide (TPR) repeat protein
MKKEIRNIEGKSGKTIGNNGFESDLLTDRENSALFATISDYMKGHLDVEDVQNDPAFSVTKEGVMEMISDYSKNIPQSRKNEEFIRDIFSDEVSGMSIDDEIKNIKREINNNRLNEITAEWVKEWHLKKQMIGAGDPKTREITDFIKSSLSSQESKPVKTLNDDRGKGSGKSVFVRYASLTAAALIGALILLKTLLPSSDPEKLFNTYYKPFDAISPVTRSINNNGSDSYFSGIGSYKTGNYQLAAKEFASAVEKDPSGISQQFFLGLSQLALRNYDQAINMLSGVVNDSGEYGKEARWYLGLSCLKTGNKQKAAECFEYLSKSAGFYRERSAKILRRLK